MPEVVACPHCNKKLRVLDELVGAAVRCPSCGGQFTASAETPRQTAREELSDERSGSERRDDAFTARPTARRPQSDSNAAAGPRRDRDEYEQDEEDYDDERPRRRRRKRSKRSLA